MFFQKLLVVFVRPTVIKFSNRTGLFFVKVCYASYASARFHRKKPGAGYPGAQGKAYVRIRN
ncbi:hypothetical protein HX99_04405 [Peptococcaceae bacterium SCADC1_2_3]|nr:hypothetical protein DK28_0203610 [Peptococcaceae bacterium SCADC1_2_3]KFI36430.1 hypothetical protein HX99_04405 [Peptococcaceae bacterium SCADC1_2_3]KFI36688.1 hypothetical protein HY02_00965 [Peptococcaceae bacterium SCADC1_2_3]